MRGTQQGHRLYIGDIGDVAGHGGYRGFGTKKIKDTGHTEGHGGTCRA